MLGPLMQRAQHHLAVALQAFRLEPHHLQCCPPIRKLMSGHFEQDREGQLAQVDLGVQGYL